MFGKEKIVVTGLFLIIVSFNQCRIQNNEISRMKLFDLNWKFNYGSNIIASDINYDDQNWRSIDLPHDCNKDSELIKFILNQSDSATQEFGWYRKHFEIPKDWKNKNIHIDFEGIANKSEIYVNGKSLTESKKVNSSFHALLNPYLNYEGNNVIVVRVAMTLQKDKILHTESGIYKHVWLVIQESKVFND